MFPFNSSYIFAASLSTDCGFPEIRGQSTFLGFIQGLRIIVEIPSLICVFGAPNSSNSERKGAQEYASEFTLLHCSVSQLRFEILNPETGCGPVLSSSGIPLSCLWNLACGSEFRAQGLVGPKPSKIRLLQRWESRYSHMSYGLRARVSPLITPIILPYIILFKEFGV